jgi:DNA-binding response OmpR family regulator
MEKNIFIIDDDRAFLSIMKEHLRQTGGFFVEGYFNPDVALKEIEMKDPFLVILDHNLSDSSKSGLYYLKEIRRLKSDVPILYMTGENSKSLEKEVLKAGANAFIVKNPTSLIQLRKAIDDITSPKKKQGLFAKLFSKL